MKKSTFIVIQETTYIVPRVDEAGMLTKMEKKTKIEKKRKKTHKARTKKSSRFMA